MTEYIVVAVNDSPAAFGAAQFAIDLAQRLGVGVRAVTVLTADPVGPTTHGFDAESLSRGMSVAMDAAVGRVERLARDTGVEIATERRVGSVAAEILAVADEIDAMLIVIARVDRRGSAIPYVGSHTLRVIEFASIPVLVVPSSPKGR